VLPVLGLLLCVGCSVDPDDSGGDSGQTTGCDDCHGTGDLGLPPPDLSGSTDPARPGVGAHEAHSGDSSWHGTVRCVHCHVVPETVDDPGHNDDALPAEVVLDGLATAGLVASYGAEGCLVYCHGGALKGGANTSPPWTSTDALGCADCHANPPAAPHPDATNCNRCHIDILDDDQAFTDPLRHIDAILQAPHGAHIVHLGGAGGGDFACTTCHQGDDYHAALIDGYTLDDTGVCASCHHGNVDGYKAQWHTYVPPGWD